MPDPQALLSGFASTPAPALATSRDDIDPVQLGALVAQLAHATSKKPTPSSPDALTPPQQSSPQPVLSPGAARVAAQPIEPPLAVSHAQVPVSHIGAPVVGDRYVPPSFGQIMTSDNPLQGVAEHVLGPSRPRTVQAADPYGIDAWRKGAGSVPLLMLGSTEALTGDAAQLAENAGRGLYSRVDDVASQIPEKGVHPNRVASLLKSGASSEEVAYRKVPEFLAGKGQLPVTRAELQAHLAANPAPFPERTVLGGPNPARPTTLPEGYSVQPLSGSPGRFTLVNPDNTGRVLYSHTPQEALDEAISWISNGESRTLPTKFSSYSLPGGEQYREHLLQQPNPIAAQRAALQRQIDAKVAEIQAAPKLADLNITSPEQYHASPEYARMQQVIAEHNALNEQLRALPPAPADYTGGHFDQPNVLAHVRTTERTLPGAPPPEPPAPVPQLTGADLHQQGWTVRVDREEPYSGRRQMTLLNPQGEWSGSRGMTPLTSEEYLHDHALDLNRQAQGEAQAQAAQPTGPRGRFLEEVQSDWHQAGKRTGYQTPPTPEQQARLDQLPAEIDSARRMVTGHNELTKSASNAYLDALRDATLPHLPPEYQHLTSFGDATREGEQAVRAWRAAREQAMGSTPALRQLKQAELEADQRLQHAANRVTVLQEEHGRLLQPPGVVPNAPFKEGWPDLALKQQLLDVAGDPNAHWLGFTGGKTQAARYDLSKQVSQIGFEPHEPGDYSLGTLTALDHNGDEVIRQSRLTPEELDDHIGKEPANALRQKIAEHQQQMEYERSQWSVGHANDNPKYFHIFDPNGEPMYDYSGALEHFRSEEEANQHIDELLARGHETDQQRPFISGLDLQVGGEGMRSFYDQLLPARLRKLVKPFGGTVEPFDLPTTGLGSIPETRFRLVDAAGNEYQHNYGTRDEAEDALANMGGTRWERVVPYRAPRDVHVPRTEPSWITHLSPEMKREILRKGFPLLTLPLAAGAASLASRPGAQVGTPPPVEREPPPQR